MEDIGKPGGFITPGMDHSFDGNHLVIVTCLKAASEPLRRGQIAGEAR